MHELRKQLKIHKFFVVMILKKIKWSILILHIWKSPHTGIIQNQEIRKVGLSETHASGNREASAQ